MFYFHTEDINFTLKGKRIIKSWLNNALKERGFRCGEINIIFVSDTELLNINTEKLGHNYYTDIITFDLTPDVDSNVIFADLYISVDSVLSNSETYPQMYPQKFECELCRVMIHGILHLIGEDDHTKKQKESMKAAEDTFLKVLKDSFLNNEISAIYRKSSQ